MASSMTYEGLYESLRKEKTATDLQMLSKDFLKSLVEYVEEKEALVKSQTDPLESQKKQLELHNIRKMIRELYERRESKIFQLALFSSRTHEKPDLSPLLLEEKELFQIFVDVLNDFRDGVLNNVVAGRPAMVRPKMKSMIVLSSDDNKSTRTVRLVHAVPKFVGDDLQIYGPFEPEDVACVPVKVADVLIQKGRAEGI
ncbi:MAG TPA: hypothetical protein VJB87_05840 [Candidatus Nanoarchaeia archaeon]|nr:hypothetical protein [Candidatus Nanoarchaeia archaeon]